ncbi:MAG: DNA-binding NtrC family response regulator [Planctomycetota bacterium]|jgi:DNA-binding NtrC family response regulator
MIDHPNEMSQRAENRVNVLVVTERADLATKLRAAARILAKRGISLGLFANLNAALAWPGQPGLSTLVFDAAVDSSVTGELPRKWRSKHPQGKLVLLIEHRDPMFRRSALKIGYADCVCFEEAMRADFLFGLLEDNVGSREEKRRTPSLILTSFSPAFPGRSSWLMSPVVSSMLTLSFSNQLGSSNPIFGASTCLHSSQKSLWLCSRIVPLGKVGSWNAVAPVAIP